MADMRRFLRDNAVLVAAFVLPAIVAALFILATAVPKWTVPLPQHDLVLQVQQYGSPAPGESVEFTARDGRLEATVTTVVKPARPDVVVPYPPRWKLLLFDHSSMEVREIAVQIPPDIPPGESRTVAVEALANRHVTPGDVAPDGYKVTSLNTSTGGGGIVNDLFGMNHRFRRGIAIGRNGRTIELELPAPYSENYGAILTIGWIADSR
jgi:hypothetical protein